MLHPRVIRDLCRLPMWLVSAIELRADRSVAINGWALPERGDLSASTVTMNGRAPDGFTRSHSPNFLKLFPWHDNAEWSTFHGVYRNVDHAAEEVLTFSHAGAWTLHPYSRWQDIHFPVQVWNERSVVEPDGPRMRRTQGNTSYLHYVLYGWTVAQMMDNVCRTYFGRQLNQFSSICDWGSGCARVAQAVRRMAPQSKVTGIDIDGDNIAWSKQNVPAIDFHHIPLLPPTPLPDGSFDLLYGISVFSHLKRGVFEQWRDELHRLVRPGGVILVTINTGPTLARIGSEDRIRKVKENGFDDETIDHALDAQIGDATYYRFTAMTPQEAMRLFGERFRVRELLSQASGSTQDLMICERL